MVMVPVLLGSTLTISLLTPELPATCPPETVQLIFSAVIHSGFNIAIADSLSLIVVLALNFSMLLAEAPDGLTKTEHFGSGVTSTLALLSQAFQLFSLKLQNSSFS